MRVYGRGAQPPVGILSTGVNPAGWLFLDAKLVGDAMAPVLYL